MKSKIKALENKARMEFEQLKLQSEAKTKQSSEDHPSFVTVDDSLLGDYNDVNLDEIVEIKQKNECGIDFLNKKSEGKDFKTYMSNCMYILYNLSMKSYTGMALASFPGSGVTWLRHLIHQR